MAGPPFAGRGIHRQSAFAVARLLAADASKKGGVSIKSLTLAPSVTAKKATHALTCQTLKYLSVIKELVEETGLLQGKGGRLKPELVYVLVYDLLFGQGFKAQGDAERVVLSEKARLRAALARLMVRRKVASPEELLPVDSRGKGTSIPRYVRVNTLKISVEEAKKLLSAASNGKSLPSFEMDPLLPELLVFPPGTDLHAHPMVLDGRLILQGRSSCMPGRALAPDSGWTVLDACAAPGNKTTHLAALLGKKGKVIACEKDSKRVKQLRESLKKAGATNAEALHQDFLQFDPQDPRAAEVRAILLDPSCSGSGTKAQRMDHLLPSAAESATAAVTDTGEVPDEAERQRVDRLASFQETALRHALKFPKVQKILYSTCSVYRRENEDVVAAVLPAAEELGFHLATPFPSWPHRGLPVVSGAEHLLRVDAKRDLTDGFFIALFIRENQRPSQKAAASVNGSQDKQSADEEGKLKGKGSKEAQLQRRKLKRQRKKAKLQADAG